MEVCREEMKDGDGWKFAEKAVEKDVNRLTF